MHFFESSFFIFNFKNLAKKCILKKDWISFQTTVGFKLVGSDFSACGKWYCKAKKTWWNVPKNVSKHVCLLSKPSNTLLGPYLMKKLKIFKNVENAYILLKEFLKDFLKEYCLK